MNNYRRHENYAEPFVPPRSGNLWQRGRDEQCEQTRIPEYPEPIRCPRRIVRCSDQIGAAGLTPSLVDSPNVSDQPHGDNADRDMTVARVALWSAWLGSLALCLPEAIATLTQTMPKDFEKLFGKEIEPKLSR